MEKPDVILVTEPTLVGPDALWMVASKGVAPGAFWPVRRTLVGCLRTLTCPCPRMAAQDERPPEVRDACRHIKAVIGFENRRLARPVSPPHISALVD